MNSFVIGIDGGGTRTRALLADLEGGVLGAAEAGTSNPLARGSEACRFELERAIAGAFEAAGRPRDRVTALCMGLAGADQASEQEELAGWARQSLADRVLVVNDGQIVLAAGTPENWGVALIAGTGSFAWGRNRRGQTSRAGGWGYMMGDEGSAFDLARQALRAATQFADGRGPTTTLLADILADWGLATPAELVGRAYRSGLTHTDIAGLAPVVVRAAEHGDTVAVKLVQSAATDLARAVAAVSRALDLDAAAFPLALTGGLLLGAEFLRKRLLEELEALGCECAPVELVPQPALGAVRLAVELAHDA
jgi:N-acetylglucosamine kinase-like BadF-type ATPase